MKVYCCENCKQLGWNLKTIPHSESKTQVCPKEGYRVYELKLLHTKMKR